MRTDEQIRHDRINLPRLMRRLEQAVQDTEWPKSSNRETWLKAQAMLQQIRHAKLLLAHVEIDHVDSTPAQERRYQHFGTTLQRLEDYMRQVEQQSTLPIRRPAPLLPSIRPPTTHKPLAPSSPPPPVEATLIPAESAEPDPLPSIQGDLLPATPSSSRLSPATPARSLISLPSPSPSPAPAPGAYPPSPRRTLLSTTSPSAPPSTSTSTATATATLGSSSRLQEDLSSQLALMATQLRLNATHFSQSLEKDRTVLDAVQTKLERNADQVQRERVRLRDLRGTSRGTTCLVIASVLVVGVAFVVMVFIIRLT